MYAASPLPSDAQPVSVVKLAVKPFSVVKLVLKLYAASPLPSDAQPVSVVKLSSTASYQQVKLVVKLYISVVKPATSK